MKNILPLFIMIVFILSSFLGCSNTEISQPDYSVAILMHCTSNDRMHIDAEAMQKIFNDMGYEVILQYANKDINTQNEQIIYAIENQVDAMIISPVSQKSLHNSLEPAANANIPVISYDKLILNSDAVSYFAAYDHNLTGIIQAFSLIEGLRSNGEGPYNVELFVGTSKEANDKTYFKSAMSVLQPLIDSGEILIVSGQTSYTTVNRGVNNISDAGVRLENIINTYYDDKTQLHGILSPSDKMSLEFINVLNINNDVYNHFPVITGQNAQIESVRAIINSRQYSTVHKNPYVLAQVACNMVISVLNGETPEINDSVTFDNGKKIVPAYLCEPILVTKDNYKTILLDTGYYEYIEVFPEY